MCIWHGERGSGRESGCVFCVFVSYLPHLPPHPHTYSEALIANPCTPPPLPATHKHISPASHGFTQGFFVSKPENVSPLSCFFPLSLLPFLLLWELHWCVKKPPRMVTVTSPGSRSPWPVTSAAALASPWTLKKWGRGKTDRQKEWDRVGLRERDREVEGETEREMQMEDRKRG